MIELPEALVLSKQLADNIIGLTVKNVFPPTKPHKFCWFNGDPSEYEKYMKGAIINDIEAFGMYVEIILDNGYSLCFNDGVNVRLNNVASSDYQLKIQFLEGDSLSFTVAMYGGIVLHKNDYDNAYYIKSKNFISPFSAEFDKYFYKAFDNCKKTISVKAFLATEQRFPGIGNGTLQDILFAAEIHPKRKIATLSVGEKDFLLCCIKAVLLEMTTKGGRDTEKNLFGFEGGYKTVLSKKTLSKLCPVCGSNFVKSNYLGGSVYFCPKCQPLSKNTDQ